MFIDTVSKLRLQNSINCPVIVAELKKNYKINVITIICYKINVITMDRLSVIVAVLKTTRSTCVQLLLSNKYCERTDG